MSMVSGIDSSCNETVVDRQWMARALILAQQAELAGEVPVGALLVSGNEVLGEGWNRPISGCDPTAHAEIVALRAAAQQQQNYRLPKSTLYVTIEPCTMCLGAIIHARVERLVFGAYEPRAGAVASQLQLLNTEHYNHRIEWLGGVMEQQCSELISQFFRTRRQQQKKPPHT